MEASRNLPGMTFRRILSASERYGVGNSKSSGSETINREIVGGNTKPRDVSNIDAAVCPAVPSLISRHYHIPRIRTEIKSRGSYPTSGAQFGEYELGEYEEASRVKVETGGAVAPVRAGVLWIYERILCRWYLH